MRIKVWGTEESTRELLQVNLFQHEWITEELDPAIMQQCDLFIDLHPDKFYNRLDLYEQFYPIPVLVNCVKDTLSNIYKESFGNKERFRLFGFNALHTFINRPVAEVSVLRDGFKAELHQLMTELGWAYCLVEDQVGMVTPRVVSMIINEAYYTVQEGTATKEDIDKAMKLGTNYPFGPFEWGAKIGIKQIYELLEGIHRFTCDERYKIAPLLKKEYKEFNLGI